MKPLIDAPPASSTHVIYLMGPVSAGSLQPFASSFIAPWVNLCIPDYQLRLVQWSCLGSSALPKSSSLMAPSHFVVPRVLLGQFTKGPPILLLTVLRPYILVTLLGLPAMFCLPIPSIISSVVIPS
ncbi:hypothetical protein F2P79_024519, partial [Pimephales promelas]